MQMSETRRGFAIGDFTDSKGVSCSLQESSQVADDDGAYLWVGCNDIGLKRFEPGLGWSDVDLETGRTDGVSYIANTRMHLTQTQVAELLPALQHFAECGTLPE